MYIVIADQFITPFNHLPNYSYLYENYSAIVNQFISSYYAAIFKQTIVPNYSVDLFLVLAAFINIATILYVL